MNRKGGNMRVRRAWDAGMEERALFYAEHSTERFLQLPVDKQNELIDRFTPPLTDEEKAVLDSISIDEIIELAKAPND